MPPEPIKWLKKPLFAQIISSNKWNKIEDALINMFLKVCDLLKILFHFVVLTKFRFFRLDKLNCWQNYGPHQAAWFLARIIVKIGSSTTEHNLVNPIVKYVRHKIEEKLTVDFIVSADGVPFGSGSPELRHFTHKGAAIDLRLRRKSCILIILISLSPLYNSINDEWINY